MEAPAIKDYITRMLTTDERDDQDYENYIFPRMGDCPELLADCIRNALPLVKGRISDTQIIIPRVPERLRRGENDAYEPRIISLGPYHHGERKLRAMERYKLSYLHEILSRDPMIQLDNCVNLVSCTVDEIRSCYPDYFELGPLKFVVVMVIDGCFIVEYLLRVHESVKDELNRAGDQTIISNIDITSLTSHKDSSIMIPGVTVLQEAGIRFKVEEAEGSSLDVAFIEGEGEMVIPRLLIDSSTKSKLRNLIAFEQLYPNYESKFYRTFSVYCSFMNDIINTPEDVALLCEKDIIRHSLGSNDEVAHIFNHVNGGAIIAQSHDLNDIYQKVGDYRKARWHRWRANLMHNYLNSPWAVLGIVAGAILLVLTFLQTYFSGGSAY